MASLEDLYTRKIVGWAAGARMTQALVLAALDQAVRRYRPAAGVSSTTRTAAAHRRGMRTRPG